MKDDSYKSLLGTIEAPIQRNDILSISISSLNAEASAIFNPGSNPVDKQTTTSSGGNIQSGGYLVNSDGNIQLPILGNVTAAGITKKQLRDNITNTILTKKLLIDPIVDIQPPEF